jgi:hypothetical protein
MNALKTQYVIKYKNLSDTDHYEDDIFLFSFDDLDKAIVELHKRRSLYKYNEYSLYQTITYTEHVEILMNIPYAPEMKSSITFGTCPNKSIIVANAAIQEALDWVDQNIHFFDQELNYQKEMRQILRQDFNLRVNSNYDFEEVLTHLATFPGSQVVRHVPEITTGHYV